MPQNLTQAIRKETQKLEILMAGLVGLVDLVDNHMRVNGHGDYDYHAQL